MHRILLGLVITDGSLLLVTYILGFFASPTPGDARFRFGHDLHLLLAILTVMFTMMVHAIAYTYFIGTGKWVREVVRVYQLPTWLEERSRKGKRRIFPFVFWSMMAIGAAAWLGAAVDTTRGMDPLWHLAAASLAILFNMAAFAAEYRLVESQARLIIEVKDQADRLREAALAAEAGSAGSVDNPW